MEVEVEGQDSELLSRSCRVRISGGEFHTPSKTVSVTRTDSSELDTVRTSITNSFKPLGEVFTRLTPDTVSRVLEDDDFGKSLSRQLHNRLIDLQSARATPYILFQFVNTDGSYYNRLPSKESLDLIFDLLWGTDGNSLVLPPLLGPLPQQDYHALTSAIAERIHGRTDKRDVPLIGLLPSSYRLNAPDILQTYWDLGCRLFAFDCENKKFGAFGFIIEKIHNELDRLSDRDEEEYLLHAINSKARTGRQETRRTNELLGPGFGFDSFGRNHIVRPRWVPQGTEKTVLEKNFVFQPEDYGFYSLHELSTGQGNWDEIRFPRSNALATIDLENADKLSDYALSKACKLHNVETSFNETKLFREILEDGELKPYLSTKGRIDREVAQMSEMSHDYLAVQQQQGLDAWF